MSGRRTRLQRPRGTKHPGSKPCNHLRKDPSAPELVAAQRRIKMAAGVTGISPTPRISYRDPAFGIKLFDTCRLGGGGERPSSSANDIMMSRRRIVNVTLCHHDDATLQEEACNGKGLLLLLLSGVLSGEVPADPCGAEPCNTRDMCRTGDCQKEDNLLQEFYEDTNWLQQTPDFARPSEEAGLLSGYNAMGLIQVVQEVISRMLDKGLPNDLPGMDRTIQSDIYRKGHSSNALLHAGSRHNRSLLKGIHLMIIYRGHQIYDFKNVSWTEVMPFRISMRPSIYALSRDRKDLKVLTVDNSVVVGVSPPHVCIKLANRPPLTVIVRKGLPKNYFIRENSVNPTPCENNPCNHGNCSTSGDGYLCICNDGYTGANCDLAPPDPPEFQQSAQQEPRSSTPVPKIVVPRSPVALILPTWKPRAGQKVAHLKWDEVQIVPDVACGNASSNSSTGGRLVSFDVAQNTSINCSQDTYFCHCEAAYMGSYCEEFNACHGYPCQNNATCSDVPQRHSGKNATCTCLTGYTGQRCQSVVDHCSPQPCGNGATCESSLSGFSCQCPEGFLGSLCEEKVDPCSPTPCLNNGSCYPAGLSYACSCSPGFTGPACAKLVDFCALSPCAHGICRSVGTSYKCLCIPGYHGLYCEEEYNECASTPCQNAASCRDLVNGYECVCEGEYEGRHCELYKDPCVNISCQNGGTCDNEGLNATCVCAPGFIGEECDIDVNECDSSPCHHAGTCVDQANGYTCNCPHGWVGANCEIHLQWKAGHTAESLTNMPRHSLYIIIGALCVAFLLMLIILIVGICRISRIEYQGSSRPAYEEFYNCRSIDSEFSSAIASIRHARFGKKSRPAMYDATPVSFEDYSPDDKPLVTLIKTKDL
ncbi:delta and Notch-like epidermal growth factor-related receptor [Ascaphus truei]|uniref:delta and Notch-like epidermal growth factor-related receptor n=1 Tax=Ascaphus truei TaxID=8439 RepID=UPI003F596DC9